MCPVTLSYWLQQAATEKSHIIISTSYVYQGQTTARPNKCNILLSVDELKGIKRKLQWLTSTQTAPESLSESEHILRWQVKAIINLYP